MGGNASKDGLCGCAGSRKKSAAQSDRECYTRSDKADTTNDTDKDTASNRASKDKSGLKAGPDTVKAVQGLNNDSGTDKIEKTITKVLKTETKSSDEGLDSETETCQIGEVLTKSTYSDNMCNKDAVDQNKLAVVTIVITDYDKEIGTNKLSEDAYYDDGGDIQVLERTENDAVGEIDNYMEENIIDDKKIKEEAETGIEDDNRNKVTENVDIPISEITKLNKSQESTDINLDEISAIGKGGNLLDKINDSADSKKDVLITIDDEPAITLNEVANMESVDPSVDTSDLDPASALLQRQDAIFAKLGALKTVLDQLAHQYSVPDVQSSSTGAVSSDPVAIETKPSAGVVLTQGSKATIKPTLGEGIHDIVISANPSSPPLSLFVLFELLKKQYKVLATSYVHSSVSGVDPALVQAFNAGSQVIRGAHQVALSVVWKNVENGPLLMISPTKQSVVSGEVNVARYLFRLLNQSFDTDDIISATMVDEWLDAADNQLVNGNSKQRNAVMKNLNNSLKKSDWLVGSELSLADILMWSVVVQSKISAPENVQKWLNSLTGNPLFQTAMKFV